MKINIPALQNNYLPALIISVLLSASVSAQVDTNKVRQQINAYGYSYKNISIDSSLRVPRDSFTLRYSDTSSIAIVNDVLYVWNGLKWNPVARKLTDSTIQVGSDTVLVGGTGSGGSTNLGYTASPTDGTITSTTGTSATVPLANGTNAGLLSPDWYGVINDSAVTSIVKTDSITKYYNHQGDVIHQDTASTASGIGTIIDTAQYYVSSSVDTLTLSALINKTVLSVESYPYVVSVVTGTPASDEVAFNYTTGGLKFGTSLSTGQTVKVIYSYTITSGTAAVTSVNGQTGDATIDGSETKVNPGTNVTVTGTGTTGDPYVINSSGAGGSSNLDLGSTDSTYYLLAGVLQPTFDTATNTNSWSWIKNAQHSNLNFKDSIVATTSYVSVYYKNTGSRVISFLIVPDETTSTISRTTSSYLGKSGAIYYTNGPYFMGSRVFADSAYIYFSKFGNLSTFLKWNGSSWVWGNDYNGIIDFGSIHPTATWTTGSLDITSIPFSMRKTPSVMMYRYNASIDSLLAYYPTISQITPTRCILNFWDIRNNSKLTLSTPPTNFGVYLDFGTSAGLVNPITEDFGPASNFWVIAVMKKNSMGNIFSYGLLVTFLLSFVFRRKKYLAFGLFLLPVFSQAQIKDKHRVQYENISTTNIDTTNYKPIVVNASGERFKTYWYGSAGGGSGTVSNSASANRLAYYSVSGTTVTALAAITANRALASDANGLPVASATTATELGYVSGVTSAIQTQIDGKQASDADLTSIAAISGTNVIPYRSASNTWGAVTIGSGLSFSGGTLSASGGSGMAIGSAVTSGTSQSVLFVDASGNLAQDNSHFKFNSTSKLFTVDSASLLSVNVQGKIYSNGFTAINVPSTITGAPGSTVAVGGALPAITSGVRNVGIGQSALTNITTGFDNTAVGHSSLIALSSTSADNTAGGYYSGINLSGGNYNTFLGALSGYGYTGGNTGVFIGYHTAPIYTSGNNGQININGAIWGVNTAYNATNPLIGIGVFSSSYAPLYTLHVGGTFGLKKDSIPLVTSATNYQTLVVDTTTGKVSRIVTPTGSLSDSDRNFIDSLEAGLIADSISVSLVNGTDVYLKRKPYGDAIFDSIYQFSIPNTSAWDSVIRTTLITTSAGADFSNAALSRIVNVPNGSIGTIRYEASANDGSGNFYSDIIFLHYSKTVGGTLTIYTGTSSPGTVNVGLPSETGIAVANVGDNLAFKVTTGTVTAAADVFWKLNICLTINSGGSF